MKFTTLTSVLFSLIFTSLVLADEARLLRFPAIHDDQVVFSYAGDLYTVPSDGGVARRLTSHIGYEMFARFSPDGETLAFTAQYDGNTEVYVMPAQGGQPKRLTYTATLGRDDVSDRMGPNNIVMGWTPDGKSVVFRSRMTSFNSFKGSLYTVDLEGGLPVQLEVPVGGFCSFQGDRMAYNRVFREFRTWKRYRGGMADDIWIHDFNDHTTTNITNNPAQDIFPMWHDNTIYFISDRDNGRMNLFAYDLKKEKNRKLTDFQDFDIKFPSLGNDAIIFENGGWLYRVELPDGEPQKIDIEICEDLSIGRDKLINVDDQITNFDIAPDGKRALMGARGDVFTIPARNGEVRNLTGTPGVHERNSTWSPDGRWIAWISDATGEDEIYLTAQDGSGEPQQMTSEGDTYLFSLRWSPDSRKLLWSDRRMRLRYIDIEQKEIVEIDSTSTGAIRQYEWSPDSRWVVYVHPEWQAMNRLYLYNLEDGESFPVTDGWFDVKDPVFSRNGKYLLFTSNRDFNPIYSWTEWNHAYIDMEKVYLITLAADTPSPFAYESDETAVNTEATDKSTDKPAPKAEKKKKKTDTKKNTKNKKEPESKPVPADKTINVKIDREGIMARSVSLPIPPSAYGHIDCVEDTVYYTRNGYKDNQTLLFMFDLKEKKQTELGSVSSYTISANGKKMLLRNRGSFGIIDLPRGSAKIDNPLNLSGMTVYLDRQSEWRQIYDESWRQLREFFHVPNMHGVDWPGMRERYAPLVDFVNHRCDLTYVIGEMISELNCGHAYVNGGDYPQAPRIKLGLLGARISRDDTGYFQIDAILPGQNWDRPLRSPLTEIGVDVHEQDYIIAIDGVETNTVTNLYELLIDKAGRQVELTVNNKPRLRGSRKTIVKPIDDESELYYYQWVQTNIDTVSEATDGKVGYIHVPDMGVPGLNEFVKHFYPQLSKKALIIDVRGNGGGNVSPMLIERLRREIAMITYARNIDPTPNPGEMIVGPLVCLCDEYSASDGDLFTYRFKQHKLGPVIGKTTWGGVVGISGSLPFLDGGSLMKPEHSRYDIEGKNYIIEGVGVEPDIFVDNDPWQEYQGNDQQLDKAIEVILEKLKTEEVTLPPLPPYPVK